MIECINPSTEIEQYDTKFEDKYKILEEYIIEANNKKPIHYKTLQDMIFGSLISAILYTKGYSDLISIKKPQFKDSTIYLDTNFIFSLLNLDSPYFSEPAIELYNLIRINNIKMKVFSFTLDEICRVISGYTTEFHKYSSLVRVNTIYSSLKIKGWTKSTVQEFIINLEKILEDKGLEIEWIPKFEVDNFKPQNTEHLKSILKYKPDISLNTLLHDLMALDKISKIRFRTIRIFDQANSFFLTSDIRLNHFNLVEMGHKDNGTICETILDRTLTNLLWLRNPSSNPSLKSVMSIHSHDMFVKRNIWGEYYRTLVHLKKREIVSDTDIEMLFYNINLEEVLKQYNGKDAYKINPELILGHIEKSRNIEGEIRLEIKEHLKAEYEKMFDEKILEINLEKEKEKQQEWYEKISKIKLKIRQSSKKTAYNYSIFFSSILTVILLTLVFIFYYISKQLDLNEIYTFILPLSMGGGGIWGIFFKVKNKIEKRYETIIYNNQIKKLGIDSI